MESFKPPAQLDIVNGNVADNWRRWKQQFELYMLAVGGYDLPEDRQCAVLLHVIGPNALDVYNTMTFGSGENKQLSKILQKFEEYCTPRRNVTYERYGFHMRKQAEGETIDKFVTELRTLALTCEFGDLEKSLVKDQIVVGVRDDSLRSRLLRQGGQSGGLTLEAALDICHAFEASTAQLRVMSTGASVQANIDAVKHTPKTQADECNRCGHAAHKGGERCPARNSVCHKCKKRGHWVRKCFSNVPEESAVKEIDFGPDSNNVFLGELSPDVEPVMRSLRVIAQSYDKTFPFKLDTGAGVTVLPYDSGPWPALMPPKKRLFATGNIELKSPGCFEATVEYNGKTLREVVYVVPGQSTGLLSRRLSLGFGLITIPDSVNEVQDSSPVVADVKLGLLKDRQYSITLLDEAKPYAIYAARPIPIPVRPVVEAELRRMEAMGVIRRVEEPTEWVSPMVVVPKGSGKIRICADFTRLNAAVKREVFPMATVEHSLAQLSNGKIFSKLDANCGFWQIALAPDSQKLTTFLSPIGRFCYQRLPFGLASAPEVFQREMSSLLDGLPGVVIHMDDILIFGANREEHDKHLDAVLHRIQESGLTLNPDKCVYRQTQITFLGNIISGDGIRSDPKAISTIVGMCEPKNVKELQSFLGAINQYGKFSPHYAEITTPLRALLRKNTPWIWDVAQADAFEAVKHELNKGHVLAQFNVDLPTFITADASAHGIGAVLTQVHPDGSRKLVAAASRSLSETESRYACIERECLALTWACDRFRMYVMGLPVTFETDHKPLVPILTAKDVNKLSPRLQRFRLRLMWFDYTVRYIPGKDNKMADLLSRTVSDCQSQSGQDVLEVDAEEFARFAIQTLPITSRRLQEIKRAQGLDEVCQQVIKYVQTSWPKYLSSTETIIKPYWDIQNEFLLADGLLLRGNRIVIPSSERLDVLQRIHVGHWGISKCRAQANECVWWPGMSSAIEQMVKSCTRCAKETPVRFEPLKPTEWPTVPWHTIASDLFEFRGSQYLLVVDYHSRYPELARLESTSSACVINHLKSIFSRHGIPYVLRSDNGPCYASTEFRQFAKQYDFVHITSSPRFPQANGEAERFVRTIKAALKKNDDPYLALLSYRNTPLANGVSPARLLMNRSLRTILPTLPEQSGSNGWDKDKVQVFERDYRAKMAQAYDTRHQVLEQPELSVGQPVIVRDTRQPASVTASADRSIRLDTDTGPIGRNRRDVIPLDSEPEVIDNDSSHLRAPSSRVRKPPQRYGFD